MKNTEQPRREHAGGSPKIAYEGENFTVVKMYEPDIAADIDERNGWHEPGAKAEAEVDVERDELGVAAVTSWYLMPFVRRVRIGGKPHLIIMKPMRSCYLKALAMQLCLRPESFGVKRPSLAFLAENAKVSAQSLGRILIELREIYPSFVARCMRSEAVREIYRQAQLARLEPDQEAFIQLTLPFGPGNSN